MRYTYLHICQDGLRFRNKRFCQTLLLCEIYFDWARAFNSTILAAHEKEMSPFWDSLSRKWISLLLKLSVHLDMKRKKDFRLYNETWKQQLMVIIRFCCGIIWWHAVSEVLPWSSGCFSWNCVGWMWVYFNASAFKGVRKCFRPLDVSFHFTAT